MSVLDDLRGLESRVVNRIKELESAVAELDELRTVAERLGLDVTPAKPAATRSRRRAQTTARRRASKPVGAAGTTRANAPTRAARTPKPKTGSRTSKSRRTRRDDILASVKRQPGVSVAEIGKRLGVDPTGLYRIVSRLEDEGLVRRESGKLQLAATK